MPKYGKARDPLRHRIYATKAVVVAISFKAKFEAIRDDLGKGATDVAVLSA